MQPYSPERRTALVFCGTGAHGAYHAGVLRALQEAGVKIDVVAGQGVGAAAAALAAIDGGSRLWDTDGIWRGAGVRRFYKWKWPLRAVAWLAGLLAISIALTVGMTVLGLSTSWQPALAAGLISAALALMIAAGGAFLDRATPARRRAEGRSWWRLLGAPLDAEVARHTCADALWQLIRGAGQAPDSPRTALGGRYAEVLADNLGQPGFRELMLVATDLDARHDVVAALLQEPYSRDFAAARPGSERRSEIIDLAGTGREHAFDMIAAALTPPVACDPQLVSFGVDSYWRGETHRLCDRPGACSRLLEELAAAGVSQAIIVSGVAAPPAPHRLTAPRLELRHRLGEFLAASESAALRDAMDIARLRFDSVYLVRPLHNPVGPFDLAGAYDDASDRMQDLSELMTRAYEDAYHQFIEPMVGASGERLAQATPEPG